MGDSNTIWILVGLTLKLDKHQYVFICDFYLDLYKVTFKTFYSLVRNDGTNSTTSYLKGVNIPEGSSKVRFTFIIIDPVLNCIWEKVKLLENDQRICDKSTKLGTSVSLKCEPTRRQKNVMKIETCIKICDGNKYK